MLSFRNKLCNNGKVYLSIFPVKIVRIELLNQENSANIAQNSWINTMVLRNDSSFYAFSEKRGDFFCAKKENLFFV